MLSTNSFGSRSVLRVGGASFEFYSLRALDKAGTYTLRATTPGQAGTIPVTTAIAIWLRGFRI